MRWIHAALLCIALGMLPGCTATSALSAATSALSGGGATAQVGQNNTKQGIGATVSTESTNESTIKDSTVGQVDSSKDKATKAQNIQTGSITAETITVKNGDAWDVIWASAAGAVVMLIALCIFIWLFERKSTEST